MILSRKTRGAEYGPGLIDQIGHAAQAAGRVVRAAVSGEPVFVGTEEWQRRLSICRACPGGYWSEEGNLGMGKCRHPKCGCAKLKQGLATERCPDGHW